MAAELPPQNISITDFKAVPLPWYAWFERLATKQKGVWVPSLGGNTTYNSKGGIWSKVEDVVTYSLFINVLVLGTGSAANISGLPFPAHKSAGSQMFPCFFSGLVANFVSLNAYVGAGLQVVSFAGLAAAGPTMASGVSVFQNGAVIHASGSYIATS